MVERTSSRAGVPPAESPAPFTAHFFTNYEGFKWNLGVVIGVSDKYEAHLLFCIRVGLRVDVLTL